MHELMFLCRISGGQQCKLSCIAQVGIRQFAKYGFGFVADGTLCDDFDENSGICISGKCQVSYVKLPFMLSILNYPHLENFDTSTTRLKPCSH